MEIIAAIASFCFCFALYKRFEKPFEAWFNRAQESKEK